MKNRPSRSEDELLEELGYALATPAMRDLMTSIEHEDLGKARRILLDKPQYFSKDEVEVIVQRLLRDEESAKKRYVTLVGAAEIWQEFRTSDMEKVLELLDSAEAPKAVGRLRGSRAPLWREDEILPWIKEALAKGRTT